MGTGTSIPTTDAGPSHPGEQGTRRLWDSEEARLQTGVSRRSGVRAVNNAGGQWEKMGAISRTRFSAIAASALAGRSGKAE